MKTEKLFELLTIIDGVFTNSWNTMKELVKCIEISDVEVLSKVWFDDFKQKNPQYYPLDLKEFDNWSTFDGSCIDLYFTVVDNQKLHCVAKIYDGESFHGYRTKLRFTAELILPNSFITTIEHNINWKFESYLEEEYAKHLEKQKTIWINKMKTKIING